MPADVPPGADEVGCPGDGRGQPAPPVFSDADVYAVTREPYLMQAFPSRPSPLVTYLPPLPRKDLP